MDDHFALWFIRCIRVIDDEHVAVWREQQAREEEKLKNKGHGR